MILSLRGIEVYYGAVQALKQLDLDIGPGEIVTLIGANGAGKSTTLRAISGLTRPRFGQVLFEGHDIASLPPDEIVHLGISHVPEGRRVFANLSVRENLELGGFAVRDSRQIREAMDKVLATFPRLGERLKQYAGTLSGGEQQMLAIGRSMMARPRLILLDEPSLGLAQFLVMEIFRIIREINASGTAVLLVEQNAAMALDIASRGYVLETGRVVLSDAADRLLENEMVKRAYLGE